MTVKLRPFNQSVLPTSQTSLRRLFLEDLYREHRSPLVAFAARAVHDDDAAEDIVQESFAAILAGRFPVPAVDVRRKLEIVVHFHCAEYADARAKHRLAKERLRASHQKRERVWRSWRVTPLRAANREARESERKLDAEEDG
jgi:hypothetical protein